MTKNVRAAIRAAKKEFAPVRKDAKNTHYNQRYPTLDSVLSAIEPALDEQNVEILPSAEYDPAHGKTVLVTELHHVPSGESEFCKIALPDLTDPQKVGSAITYYRRYSLGLKLNLIPEDDDDANKAAGKAAPKPAAAKPAQKAETKPQSKPADPNDPEQGLKGYMNCLNRVKAMGEALGEMSVLERIVEQAELELKKDWRDPAEVSSPRPFVLKSLFMKNGAVFDKSNNSASGVTKSLVDQVSALLDDIEMSLSGEGFEGED